MIFNWIVETSISASIMVFIVAGIRRLIKKRVNPCILYYMWFVVIIKLVIPNGPESQISIYNIFLKNEAQVVYKVETKNIIPEINVESTLKETEPELYQTHIDNKIDYLILKEALGILWGLGVVILLIRAVYVYLTMRKCIEGKEYYDEMIESILLENLKILSLKSKVRIIISNKFESPALFGVREPRNNNS